MPEADIAETKREGVSERERERERERSTFFRPQHSIRSTTSTQNALHDDSNMDHVTTADMHHQHTSTVVLPLHIAFATHIPVTSSNRECDVIVYRALPVNLHTHRRTYRMVEQVRQYLTVNKGGQPVNVISKC